MKKQKDILRKLTELEKSEIQVFTEALSFAIYISDAQRCENINLSIMLFLDDLEMRNKINKKEFDIIYNSIIENAKKAAH